MGKVVMPVTSGIPRFDQIPSYCLVVPVGGKSVVSSTKADENGLSKLWSGSATVSHGNAVFLTFFVRIF